MSILRFRRKHLSPGQQDVIDELREEASKAAAVIERIQALVVELDEEEKEPNGNGGPETPSSRTG